MTFENLTRRSRRLARLVLPLVFWGSGIACSHLPLIKKTQGPPDIAPKGMPPLTVPELQFETLRFADNYSTSVAHAADRVSKEIGTREAEVESLKW